MLNPGSQPCVGLTWRGSRESKAFEGTEEVRFALAARAHDIPFFVALPASTFDPVTPTGTDIEIEERAPEEVTFVSGADDAGHLRRIRLTSSDVRNPAFDITPAALVTAYVTDAGVIDQPAHLDSKLRPHGRAALV